MTRTIIAVSMMGALLAGGHAAAQSGPSGPASGLEIVLNGEANRLNVYDTATGRKRTMIPNAEEAPGVGLDINAEICFVPDGVSWKPAGETWFIAGEDTEQGVAAPGVLKMGWGLFRLTGDTFDSLAAQQVGKLVPDSFVTAESNPENYGCGVLPDGRIVTGDVGDQLPHQPATGQVIVWFPTADRFGAAVGPARNDFARVPHCKIDVAIGTAGGIEVDGTDVYIASNRPNLATVEPGGVYRYDTTVWPTGESPAAGCGRTDGTGEQLADADKVAKELFIPQAPGLLLTPSDIVDSGNGTFYVSSVFSGQVAEYDRNGMFVRHVVNTTGQLGGITPFGIGVARDGTLWIADIGVVGPGPAPDAGSVVRVRFDDSGNPLPYETVDEGLQFPDGIGIAALAGATSGPSGPSAPSGPSGPAGSPATPVGSVPGDTRGVDDGVLARTGAAPGSVVALLALALALPARAALRRRW